jgi:hypothetical protein
METLRRFCRKRREVKFLRSRNIGGDPRVRFHVHFDARVVTVFSSKSIMAADDPLSIFIFCPFKRVLLRQPVPRAAAATPPCDFTIVVKLG